LYSSKPDDEFLYVGRIDTQRVALFNLEALTLTLLDD
jgi:hypothetical protein